MKKNKIKKLLKRWNNNKSTYKNIKKILEGTGIDKIEIDNNWQSNEDGLDK